MLTMCALRGQVSDKMFSLDLIPNDRRHKQDSTVESKAYIYKSDTVSITKCQMFQSFCRITTRRA